MRDLSQRLAAEPELEVLLPLILDAAIEMTEAERGFLVRVLPGSAEPSLRVELARGFDQASLQSPEAEVSRTVVERVLERDRLGLVSTSEEDADIVTVSSVKARQVLSVACVPMHVRGETLGVLYLDSRLQPGLFTEDDLPILRTFAAQAALALETSLLLDAGDALPPAAGPPCLLGESAVVQALRDDIARAARSWDPVLVLGERGTGKALVARETHRRSDRAREPFLVVSCEARQPGELELELFGHPGGVSKGAGAFTLAGKGTLLVEEISGLPPSLQARLFDILRGAASGKRPLACRVMASSCEDLRAKVAEGTFHDALYYQLDVLRIIVPPLRQRSEDIPLLVEHLAREVGGKRLRPSPNALTLLESYSWPGNLRELRNEVRRLLSLEDPRVSSKHLSVEVREGRGVSRASNNYAGKTLGEVERELILAALESCQGNKARAARQLGIPRSTLYHLLERYGTS